MISYYELGPDKRLNEIVMTGSHDAGVTGGEANTQTQDLDILGQAEAGVRLFDIRITAAVVKKGGASDVVALKAYHGVGPTGKKDAVDIRTGQTGNAKVKSLWGGEYGMTLTKILADSLKFVTVNASEFLLLKFDKCHNWEMIAEACVSMLGNSIYTGGGNLNTKTLRELQGKVIVLFTKHGIEAVQGQYDATDGILAVKNLYKSTDTYQDKFNGMQYFGKGGTSVLKPFKKIDQNIEKQTKIMEKGGGGNPNVMGMMYWTTTGMNESIKDRNATMWTTPNQQRLADMWNSGLESAITSRANKYANIDGLAGGQTLKAFMPNFVMIDFADKAKCDFIFELNTIPVTVLVSSRPRILGNL